MMERAQPKIHDVPQALSHGLERPWRPVFDGTKPQEKPKSDRDK